MKSIYSKLILGFLATIIISFTIAGFIGIKNNYDKIENFGREELLSTNEYISKIVESTNPEDANYLLSKYASSSNSTISIYSTKNGYQVYGNTKTALKKNKIIGFYNESEKKHEYVDDNLQGLGRFYKGKEYSYYVYVQKDYSDQKELFNYSAVLILGCVFLVGSIIFFVIADVIVKPITKLNKATQELSKGNYKVRVTTTGKDETSKLTQSFNQMAQELNKQDETRQKFISDVSHEFQTPLTSIQGFANILKEEDLPTDQRKKYADIILYNSKRLSTLAKNMLQLTLLESNDDALDITEFSLVDQIERVIDSFGSQAELKNIEIQFNKPKKDIKFKGDINRLEQVWINLISNAIKYTNQKGLVIVSIKRNARDVVCEVEDTGIGMSQEALSHIYERFYREDKARSQEGNGLGLPIVRTIVALHDGNVDVASKENIGTKFTVTLPMEKQGIKNRLNISNR